MIEAVASEVDGRGDGPARRLRRGAKARAERAIEAVFRAVFYGLARDGEVRIRDFGSIRARYTTLEPRMPDGRVEERRPIVRVTLRAAPPVREGLLRVARGRAAKP